MPLSENKASHSTAIKSQAEIEYDKIRYRDRHRIENAFCRLKDFRRITTRYDKLSRNFRSAIALAIIVQALDGVENTQAIAEGIFLKLL